MNTARREREVNRPPTDNIAFARISAAFIKIDIVSAPPQIRGEQPSGETTTDENKLRWHHEILNRE